MLVSESAPISPDEVDRTRRFQVHHFYVVGIAEYLSVTYGQSVDETIAGLLKAQKFLPAFGKIQTRRDIDEHRLSQFLTLAWGSELQLRLSGLQDSSVLRYSNAWAPVHAYYAVFMSAQAWFAAMNFVEMVDNHTGSLNLLSNQVTQRAIFPSPWNVTCAGCPDLHTTAFSGHPDGSRIAEKVEPLSRPTFDAFWPRFGMLLHTTRDRRLKRNFGEWKRQRNRKRLHRCDKERIAQKLPATTLFDFFWRLRVRANYRDVRAFLMSSVEDSWHDEFYQCVLLTTECTCTLLQCLIASYVGKTEMDRLMREFVRAHKSDLPTVAAAFERRLELIGA